MAALNGGPSESRLGYTDAFGLVALREKIAKHYEKKYGDSVPKDRIGTERIVVTTGSSGGFLLAFTACFDVGDTVAIASSGYPCYRNILQALGCHLANIPINSEFKLTAAELRGEIQRRKENGLDELKGLILSSPSNPTGAMLSVDELKELCELCEEENIRFLSDEIYHGTSCTPANASFNDENKSHMYSIFFSLKVFPTGKRKQQLYHSPLLQSLSTPSQNTTACPDGDWDGWYYHPISSNPSTSYNKTCS